MSAPPLVVATFDVELMSPVPETGQGCAFGDMEDGTFTPAVLGAAACELTNPDGTVTKAVALSVGPFEGAGSARIVALLPVQSALSLAGQVAREAARAAGAGAPANTDGAEG